MTKFKSIYDKNSQQTRKRRKLPHSDEASMKNLQLKLFLVVKRQHGYSLRLGSLAVLTAFIQHGTGGSGQCNKLILKLMGKN